MEIKDLFINYKNYNQYYNENNPNDLPIKDWVFNILDNVAIKNDLGKKNVWLNHGIVKDIVENFFKVLLKDKVWDLEDFEKYVKSFEKEPLDDTLAQKNHSLSQTYLRIGFNYIDTVSNYTTKILSLDKTRRMWWANHFGIQSNNFGIGLFGEYFKLLKEKPDAEEFNNLLFSLKRLKISTLKAYQVKRLIPDISDLIIYEKDKPRFFLAWKLENNGGHTYSNNFNLKNTLTEVFFSNNFNFTEKYKNFNFEELLVDLLVSMAPDARESEIKWTLNKFNYDKKSLNFKEEELFKLINAGHYNNFCELVELKKINNTINKKLHSLNLEDLYINLLLSRPHSSDYKSKANELAYNKIKDYLINHNIAINYKKLFENFLSSTSQYLMKTDFRIHYRKKVNLGFLEKNNMSYTNFAVQNNIDLWKLMYEKDENLFKENINKFMIILRNDFLQKMFSRENIEKNRDFFTLVLENVDKEIIKRFFNKIKNVLLKSDVLEQVWKDKSIETYLSLLLNVAIKRKIDLDFEVNFLSVLEKIAIQENLVYQAQQLQRNHILDTIVINKNITKNKLKL